MSNGESEGGEPELPGQRTFPREERLTSSSDFRAVYESGRKAVGRTFICYVARREGKGRKFGVAVSRKVGGAVTRNRVKRYLREVYRSLRDELDDDVFIVIVARPAASKLGLSECADAVGQLLRQGDALRA